MPNPTWAIEPFRKGHHERQDFDCGVPELNDWLITRVSQFEKRDLSRTYVLVETDKQMVLAFYCLSSHSIVFNALPTELAKGLPQIEVPVALIGRLAVDLRVQGQGLGEFLLLDALRRADSLSTKIGIQAVEVQAIDESAKRFYQKYGFQELLDDPWHLLMPIRVIRKLNLPPL